MKTRLMMSIRPGRSALHLAIALLALLIAARCGSESNLTGGEEPTPTTGTIRVKVMNGGGSPITATATVRLSGPTERTTTGAIGSTLTFTDLAPGSYSLAATVSSFIDCQSASANLVAGETTTAQITCTRLIGTITGTVSSGGMPISGATVSLDGPTSDPTKTTGPDGAFTFVAVIGENTLTTSHQGFICPIRTVMVELNQTMTAEISCAPKTTGSITGRVVVDSNDGSGIASLVTLTGPANHTATTDNLGFFAFEDLAPGIYTLAATSTGWDCSAVSADVQAAQTTEVLVRCSFRSSLIGSEIEGAWWYYRRLDSQMGSCPAQLPENGTGSMHFDFTNNNITIVGLEPEFSVVGVYKKGSGSYKGTGRTVLSNGSSIETSISMTFYFDRWDIGGPAFTTGFDAVGAPSEVMLRRHRDPSGNLICTETYQASGSR